MVQNSIKNTFGFAFIFLFFSANVFSQDLGKILFISKNPNPEKVRQIANESKIKIKTFDGKKIITRDFNLATNFLVTENNDTIPFHNIYSIRSQRKLNKTEFIIGVPLFVAGTTAVITEVPLSIMHIFTEAPEQVSF